jgi:hypothetical protein
MPIRFRKSVKIAPGTRLNFSNKGVSASTGAGGVRASTGKSNGCLYNLIAMPFVIIFKLYELLFKAIVAVFKFATATPERRKISLYAVGGIAVLSAGVTVFTMLLQALGIVPSVPPTPTLDLVAMQSTAQASAYQSFTQTALALPTSTYTVTVVPTETFIPSPTNTLLPTNTPLPTRTAIPVPTIYIPPAQPTSAHPAGTSGQCRDGTYTSAQHKQGACSSHKGVSIWWGP